MRGTECQFVRSHLDELDGVHVRVTITTVVEAIPEPATAPIDTFPTTDGLAAYILGGGDLR